jgi:hypothetical protein
MKRVIADVLRLRAEPNTTSRVLADLKRGTDVDVLAPGEWLFVRIPSGMAGWVHGGYLVDTPKAAPAPPPARYRTAKALGVLYDQVNALAPHRKRTYDGTIGDAAHAERKSDHNPNPAGVVTAMDLTHDPAGGLDALKLAEALRHSRDPRIKYVIHAGRMFSAKVQPWEWRPYHGADAHQHHVHISVDPEPLLYDSKLPWSIA